MKNAYMLYYEKREHEGSDSRESFKGSVTTGAAQQEAMSSSSTKNVGDRQDYVQKILNSAMENSHRVLSPQRLS